MAEIDYTIDYGRIYSEARAAITGDSSSPVPTDGQLQLAAEAAVRHIVTMGPPLSADGVTLGDVVPPLTQFEVYDFHRAAGCETAAAFLSSAAGRTFGTTEQVRIGPVTATTGSVNVGDLAEACRNSAAQALRRIAIMAAWMGPGELFGAVGMNGGGEPRTAFDQAFGGGRSGYRRTDGDFGDDELCGGYIEGF